MPRARIAAALLGCAGLSALFAAPEPPAPYNPPLAKASDEAEKAIRRFQLDKGLKVSVWAAYKWSLSAVDQVL